jgi:hypothetical protein
MLLPSPAPALVSPETRRRLIFPPVQATHSDYFVGSAEFCVTGCRRCWSVHLHRHRRRHCGGCDRPHAGQPSSSCDCHRPGTCHV